MEALHSRRRVFGGLSPLTLYHLLVSVPVMSALAYFAADHNWGSADLDLVFWLAILAATEFLPVAGWGNTQLTISLPIHMGVILLFPAEIAGSSRLPWQLGPQGISSRDFDFPIAVQSFANGSFRLCGRDSVRCIRDPA